MPRFEGAPRRNTHTCANGAAQNLKNAPEDDSAIENGYLHPIFKEYLLLSFSHYRMGILSIILVNESDKVTDSIHTWPHLCTCASWQRICYSFSRSERALYPTSSSSVLCFQEVFCPCQMVAVGETRTWPPSLLLLIPDCLVEKLPYMLKFQLIFRDFSLSVQEIETLLSNVGRCKRSPLIFHFLMPSFLSYCLPLPRNARVQIWVILPVGWCGWLPNPSLNQPVPFCQTIFEVLTGPALWFGSLSLWPASWRQFPNRGSPVCSSSWLSQDSVNLWCFSPLVDYTC